MKFAVLSLNPGIDRVLYLPSPMTVGGLNRTCRSVTSQGSKGANVAIVLHRLGCDVTYYSFTGGHYGDLCRSFTDREGIPSHLVDSECGVRVNTKVIAPTGEGTEFNERGGVYRSGEVTSLLKAFSESDADLVCLCGSIPQGVEKDVYNFLITDANRRGKVTVLDCDGEALRLGLAANPTIIKPNTFELANLIDGGDGSCVFPQGTVERREAVADACGKVRDMYGATVLCTDGAGGAYLFGDVRAWQDAARVRPLGFSGAGDSFLAGYIAARYDRGFTPERSLTVAAAAGGAKVSLEGTLLPGALDIDNIVDKFDTGLWNDYPAPHEPTIEELFMEGIEPWNIKKICHSKTKK